VSNARTSSETTPGYRIDWLSAQMHSVGQLAAWHYDAFHHCVPDWSLSQAAAELAAHRPQSVPSTLVAISAADELLGSVSLLAEDPPGGAELGPWLASFYVRADQRGRGIGAALMQRARAEAHALGHAHLHLWTLEQSSYYERHGWERVCLLQLPPGLAVVMRARTEAPVNVAPVTR
jgi:predicted N-acetyltransferase YhbS